MATKRNKRRRDQSAPVRPTPQQDPIDPGISHARRRIARAAYDSPRHEPGEDEIRPRWAKLKAASVYSGISTRTLETYISEGRLRSSLVRREGFPRGIRLVDLRSLDQIIEDGIGEFTEMEMNRNREVSK